MPTNETYHRKQPLALLLSAVYLIVSVALVFFLPRYTWNNGFNQASKKLQQPIESFHSRGIKNFLSRTDKIFSEERKQQFSKNNSTRALFLSRGYTTAAHNKTISFLSRLRASTSRKSRPFFLRNRSWLI